ncbi:hypothetical protein [Flavobacterium lindanitolerans]|uniref:hypothetical protein n=1 Tax=Flavobacterium lindanitolerans TaxID=428988 RepID=UPI0027BB0383|nr:hypothetical protein [Flavobacterium lindanitolerans]
MRNLKPFFVVIFFGISLTCFAQKVKFKKGNVLVDDTVWIKYKDCGGFDTTCSLINMNNEELIFIKFIQRSSETLLFNRYGEQNYYEVSFLGLNKKIEIRELPKNIVKIIFNSKVIDDNGALDEGKVIKLFEKYGNSYSSQK